ncbi:hypothetical protein D3C73_711310 [compost metagenome]
MARMVAVTPSYYSVLFKKYTGHTLTHYMDVINMWNDLIIKKERYDTIEDSRELRALNYSMVTSIRWLVIQAVTYVESYLYYYYYNVSNDPKLKARLPKFNRHVQGTDIVERVIFDFHPDIKHDGAFFLAYKKYMTILKLRDRFVHTSAFPNLADNLSELHPLLNLSLKTTAEHLTSCFNFVNKVEDALPKDERLLFWKDRFDEPDFSSLETSVRENAECRKTGTSGVEQGKSWR